MSTQATPHKLESLLLTACKTDEDRVAIRAAVQVVEPILRIGINRQIPLVPEAGVDRDAVTKAIAGLTEMKNPELSFISSTVKPEWCRFFGKTHLVIGKPTVLCLSPPLKKKTNKRDAEHIRHMRSNSESIFDDKLRNIFYQRDFVEILREGQPRRMWLESCSLGHENDLAAVSLVSALICKVATRYLQAVIEKDAAHAARLLPLVQLVPTSPPYGLVYGTENTWAVLVA